MKKICFIGGFSNGGTERAAFIIANQLCEKYSIYLLNVDIYKPVFYLDSRINMEYLPRQESMLKHCRRILSFLKANQIDIVISVEADICMYTIPVSLLYRRCRYITWEHANIFQVHNRLIPYMRRYALKNMDRYIVLTKRDMKNFANRYADTKNLEYIYNAIDIPEKEPVYGVGSKTILSAGHHLPIKNFTVIPEMGKKIFARHSDWCWEIYGGKSGSCFNELAAKIREYGLENNIRLCERTNKLSEIYARSAMYVMTSRMEGLPMTLLEAKSYKLPIVSFDIETGPSEIVDDGINGYLVKPYDVDGMAEKICRLIEDRELRQSFSDNAYVGIEKFDIDVIMKKWIEVIEG